MWFITLVKFRRAPTKADTDGMNRRWADAAKWGIKRHEIYWTLGRYDAVVVSEAPDEKAAMRFAIDAAGSGFTASETMVAVSREEAVSWLK
jgi:uncharacterized protein with GYD domain